MDSIQRVPDVTGAWLYASQTVARLNLHRGLTGGWFNGLTPPATRIPTFCCHIAVPMALLSPLILTAQMATAGPD